MANNPQLEGDKRAAARQALGGGDWESKREINEAELTKRRELARAAMEGYDRRSQREQAAMRARAEAEARAKLEASLAAKRAAEREAEEVKRQAQRQAEQAALAAKKRRLEKIHQAKKIIIDLKNQTGVELSPLRTYQGDLTQVNAEASTVRDLLQNTNYKRIVFKDGVPAKNKNWWLALGSLGLIIVGLGLVASAWYFFNGPGEQVTPVVKISTTTLLPAENEAELYLTGKAAFELRAEITQLINNAARDFAFAEAGGGPLLAIYPTEALALNEETGEATNKTAANLNRFLAALDLALPTEFRVALGDQFMFGVYQAPAPAPFYVFTVRSYERAAGELLADAGRIAGVLFDSFSLNPALAKLLRDGDFADQVIDNIDARVLTDAAGRKIMIYAFLDDETLVLAGSEAAFSKLVNVYRTPLPNQ